MEKAADIYRELLEILKQNIRGFEADIIVFHENEIDLETWGKTTNFHERQKGNDIGKKMYHALFSTLKKYKKAILIGCDCPYLSTTVLSNAKEALNKNSVVFGPANDGGYYLIGATDISLTIFENIAWSTSVVLEQSLEKCKSNNFNYALVDRLNDIDEEKDWLEWLNFNTGHKTKL